MQDVGHLHRHVGRRGSSCRVPTLVASIAHRVARLQASATSSTGHMTPRLWRSRRLSTWRACGCALCTG